jgi:uncharacterized lipoprotein NlpE involved in copper resistance
MKDVPTPVKEGLAVLFLENKAAWVATKIYLRVRNLPKVAAELGVGVGVAQVRVAAGKAFLTDYIRGSFHTTIEMQDIEDSCDDLIYYE